MRPHDVISLIRTAVENVKRSNQEVVSADALLGYLSALQQDLDKAEDQGKRQLEADLAVFRADHERNLAHYEAQQSHSLEMLRAVITYGQAALKSAILINGGAAAALLAFIGNVWDKGVAQAAVGSVTSSVILFAYGVLTAAIGTAGSYFAQYYYSEGYQRTGVVFHTLTVVLVVASYICFALGANEAYTAFVEHLSPNIPVQETPASGRH